MNNQTKSRKYYDDIIEPEFVLNYSEFALQINLNSSIALLEKACICQDSIEKKCLCLNGIQLHYNSLEDFSILLHAFINKKKGIQLHLTIGVEQKNKKGTTFVPQKMKAFNSIQNVIDILGFDNIDINTILDQTKFKRDDLERYFQEIVDSVKNIGRYQEQINDSKNSMKHGKALLNEHNDFVSFIKWKKIQNKDRLDKGWLDVSIEELRKAAIQVAKIYKQSVDLLWLFILNYYPDREPLFRSKVIDVQTSKCDEFLHRFET